MKQKIPVQCGYPHLSQHLPESDVRSFIIITHNLLIRKLLVQQSCRPQLTEGLKHHIRTYDVSTKTQQCTEVVNLTNFPSWMEQTSKQDKKILNDIIKLILRNIKVQIWCEIFFKSCCCGPCIHVHTFNQKSNFSNCISKFWKLYIESLTFISRKLDKNSRGFIRKWICQ